MKFQKGLLNDVVPAAQPAAPAVEKSDAVTVQPEIRPIEPTPTAGQLPVVEKDRLFETLEKETSNARKYLAVFGVVVVIVLAIGGTIAYLWLPSIGDRVRVSAPVEMAVRDHFLVKEKRTATEISFYHCEGFYGARVGVETRTDIPNPIFRIDTYSAKIVERDGGWEITAAPLASPAGFEPCK